MRVKGAEHLKNPKRKPQEDVDLEALESPFIVWIPNGTGPHGTKWLVQGFIEQLGPDRSLVKTKKGGYRVFENSEIRTKRPK